MEDFVGFKFDGVRSEVLGIKRVSGGDRYNEKLHPDMEDKTAEVPGLDGSYFFGTDYKARTIDIDIAFDHLTEEQLRTLRTHFGSREIKELIFDEEPYKRYMAKIESPIELSYVCFDELKRNSIAGEQDGVRRERSKDKFEEREFSDSIVIAANSSITYQLPCIPVGEVTIEGEIESSVEEDIYTFTNNTEEDITVTISFTYEVFVPAWEQVKPYVYSGGTQRIYKGDGTISFVCYFPFAKSAFKTIPDGEESDWAISSRILTVTEYGSVDRYDNTTGRINVYNAGDLPTGFRLYIPGAQNEQITIAYKKKNADTSVTAALVIDPFTLETGDSGILIDTTKEIILGANPSTVGNEIEYTTTGNIYNKYINSGYFFHLEPNAKNDGAFIQINTGGLGTDVKIFYDYLYF